MTDKIRMGALAGRRLLVVEGHYRVACELDALLGAYGAEVLGPCATREEALSLVDRAEGAVLDVDLLGELAFPTATRLSERNRAFVFVVSAGGGDPRLAKWTAMPWLERPCDPYDVVAALARAMDRVA